MGARSAKTTEATKVATQGSQLSPQAAPLLHSTQPSVPRPQPPHGQRRPAEVPVSRTPMGDDKQVAPPPVSSWADRVEITNSETCFRLDFVNIDVVGDEPILMIPDELIAESSAYWHRCILGFFSGYIMPYHASKSIALRAWKTYGLEDVKSTVEGFLIFQFRDEDSVHSVIEDGPWLLGGKSVILQQWHVQFSVREFCKRMQSKRQTVEPHLNQLFLQ